MTLRFRNILKQFSGRDFIFIIKTIHKKVFSVKVNAVCNIKNKVNYFLRNY